MVGKVTKVGKSLTREGNEVVKCSNCGEDLEIEWEKENGVLKPYFDSANCYFRGECKNCGKVYHHIFNRGGIWTADRDEQVRLPKG